MRRILRAFIFVAFPLASALAVTKPGSAQQAAVESPAVALASLDRTADPCVDFYQFACGGWLKNNPIPSDRSTWATFDDLQERNDTKLRQILETAAATPTEQTRKIGDYYGSCMDEDGINTRGLTPLQSDSIGSRRSSAPPTVRAAMLRKVRRRFRRRLAPASTAPTCRWPSSAPAASACPIATTTSETTRGRWSCGSSTSSTSPRCCSSRARPPNRRRQPRPP